MDQTEDQAADRLPGPKERSETSILNLTLSSQNKVSAKILVYTEVISPTKTGAYNKSIMNYSAVQYTVHSPV